jgi:hypothetical protein
MAASCSGVWAAFTELEIMIRAISNRHGERELLLEYLRKTEDAFTDFECSWPEHREESHK